MTDKPDRRIHLICNAHLDPVWIWEWEEGAAEAMSTFRTAADLCEQFDAFVFNHNEVILYRYVEEYEPTLFRRIQRLVKRGRWRIMGGWHLQPDCNMPSGESLARQILAGRRYFSEKFGVEPTTAINFDPFGHTRGLVQILAKAGFDSYLFGRPVKELFELPDEDFVWVGYDGSEVLASRLRGWYNSPLGRAREKIENWMRDFSDLEVGAVLWGVGNHGGGPSRRDLQSIEALRAETGDAEILHSSPEDFFADLRKTTPPSARVERDLNPWAPGCYVSQIRIKQEHRRLENEIYATEKMCVAAAAQRRMDYPADELAAAEDSLLTCQFHDILPGSSIQPAEETALRLLGHGRENVSRARARAFFALSEGQPRAGEGETPVFVFNPHPFDIRTLVECEFCLPDFNRTGTFFDVTAHEGRRALPTQVEQEISNLDIDWRKRVVFEANLKAGRMNRFDCRYTERPARPRPKTRPRNGAIRFKTDDMEVVINERTGLIDRYRVGRTDFVRPGAMRPVVIEDDADSWARRATRFPRKIGAFRLLSQRDAARFAGVDEARLAPVRVIEEGDARMVVEALMGHGDSFLCLRYKLPRSGARIEVEARVYWLEKDRMLKLEVPTARRDLRYRGQVAWGVGDLPADGDEAVAQRWTAVVDDRDIALTCVNDGTYASDCAPGRLRLTLLRSPAYSALPIGEQDRLTPPDRFTPRMDQGERRFRFWFEGGPAAERLTRIEREAQACNETPFVLSFYPSGKGEAPKPLATLSDGAVVMPAFRRSLDGRAWIARLFEPTGRRRRTTLRLPFAKMDIPLTMQRFEVKTLRIDPRRKTWTEVNLLERQERRAKP